MNACFNTELSEDEARKRMYGIWMLMDEMSDAPLSKLPYDEVTRIRDERNALRAEQRLRVRQERFYDLLDERLDNLATSPLSLRIKPKETPVMALGKTAILQISDIHYGIEVDNAYNTYNKYIANSRLSNVAYRVIGEYERDPFEELTIVFQGDLISGKIHTTLRLQNQMNVADQIIEISELLGQFVDKLAEVIPNISCVFVGGNHERMTDKKEHNLDDENFIVIIKKFIERFTHNNVKFIDSKYGIDLATFETNGLKVAAVHGDNDPFSVLYSNITGMTHEIFDIILTAHKHELRVAEEKRCTMIANGSLVGVDDYAKRLRYNNKPSQNLIYIYDDGSLAIRPIVVGGEQPSS